MYNRLRTRLDAGRQDGFTLIELLIVIVILGVLAGIVVFAVGGISDRGTTSACSAEKKTLEVAQEAHFAKTKPGAYAADAAALKAAGLIRDPGTLYTTTGADGADTDTLLDSYSVSAVANSGCS